MILFDEILPLKYCMLVNSIISGFTGTSMLIYVLKYFGTDIVSQGSLLLAADFTNTLL